MKMGNLRYLPLLACFCLPSTQAANASVPATADSHIEVSVAPLQDSQFKQFSVTWRLPKPVTSLSLGYCVRNNVCDSLKPLDADVRFEDGKLTRVGAGEFSEVHAIVTYDPRLLIRSYGAVYPFSSSGALIYTGYLKPDGATAIDYHLTPPQGGFVGVGAQFSDKPLERQFLGNTLFYFGSIRPDTLSDGTPVLIDPAISADGASYLKSLAGTLMPLYRARFGWSLSNPPSLYFMLANNGPHDPSLMGHGDVAHYALIVRLFEDPGKTSSAGRLLVAHLVAHEMAHLWNGSEFTLADNNPLGTWILEGGAEALADAALLQSGYIDSDYWSRRATDYLNLCRLSTVSTSVYNHSTNEPYDCGGAIMTAAGAGAKRASHGKDDIFSVWHELFESAHATGNHYDTSTFLDAVEKSAGPAYAARLARLLLSSGQSADQQWSALLHDAGMSLSAENQISEKSSGRYSEIVAQNSLAALMGGACDGEVSLQRDATLHTFGLPDCADFAIDHVVESIDGLDPINDGLDIYKTMQAQCVKGEIVTLKFKDQVQPTAVRCDSPLFELPHYLQLKNKAIPDSN